MATYQAEVTLVLSADEAMALRDFLGNMTGSDYEKASDNDEIRREFVEGIYAALPKISD